MQRRTFLKTALTGALLAADYQVAAAAGIGQSHPDTVIPAKPKAAATSLKGMITNDENPEKVNALNVGWMEIEFGPWNWNYNAKYNAKWALHLYQQEPDPTDVQRAMQHDSYDGWWMTLNEPDLEQVSTSQAVALITKQMRTVLSVDPNAKFCVSGGSQLAAPFLANGWLPPVWKKLPSDLKPYDKAFQTHYYPQAEFGDREEMFTPEPVQRYLSAWRDWMNKRAKDTPRQLWLTEVGVAWSSMTRPDPRVVLYPLMLQQAIDGYAERWAWYSMSKPDGYATLFDNATSSLTPEGKVFAAIQPGRYPIKRAA